MKKISFIISIIFITSLFFGAANANEGAADADILSTSALHPGEMDWEFNGVFGRFDRQSVQRGFQIYKEVCSACHSLKLVSYRNLADIGFGEDEIKQIASDYTVTDGPNDDGEMFDRPALPSDRFVLPYPNDKAAAAANGGAIPPDFSLIAKARHEGPDYIYSLITGYIDAPDGFPSVTGKYYNPYFEGRQISMPHQLPMMAKLNIRMALMQPKSKWQLT